MTSPFDSKNRVAAALDRLALRVLLFVLSVGYFFFLWFIGGLSLLAGSALKPKNASARCWPKPWAATRGIPF